MARVTGLGGAFLRANDPKALYAWYSEHLGIASHEGCFSFPREVQRAYIAVAFFQSLLNIFPRLSLPCSISKWTISTALRKTYRPREPR